MLTGVVAAVIYQLKKILEANLTLLKKKNNINNLNRVLTLYFQIFKIG